MHFSANLKRSTFTIQLPVTTHYVLIVTEPTEIVDKEVKAFFSSVANGLKTVSFYNSTGCSI